MKKLLLFTVALAFGLKVFAQVVPNGTFENWTSTPYNDLALGWNSGNLRDIQSMATGSVTKVSGVTGFAVRIQTNINGSDTSESYIINTANPCSDPQQWTGGVPFSQQPTALTGSYRYNLPAGDSALIIVIFRKNGLHIGDNMILIKGTGSQSTFASFSFPVTCAGVPDSVIIAAASSNKISGSGVQNGSFLELDNLAFAGTTQTIPNGDFESWTAKSYDVVAGWEQWGAENGVTQTTASYAGTYAIRLETIGDGCSGTNSSGITTGHNTSSNGPQGGLPYTGTNDTLCGYYKYAPMPNDSALIYINLSNNHNNIGGGWKPLAAATTYTYFEVPIWAGGPADTMRIDIQSSKWPTLPSYSGSVLYIDNLSLKSMGLGIFETGNSGMKSSSYPNPAKDLLYIKFDKNVYSSVNVAIYDLTGRNINTDAFSVHSNSLQVNVGGLPSGIYFYEIKTTEGFVRNKFIKE